METEKAKIVGYGTDEEFGKTKKILLGQSLVMPNNAMCDDRITKVVYYECDSQSSWVATISKRLTPVRDGNEGSIYYDEIAVVTENFKGFFVVPYEGDLKKLVVD